MNNRYKTLILSAILLLGFGKYLPLYYCPEHLQNFYFNNGLFMLIASFVLILVLTFKWKFKLYKKLIFIALPVLGLLLSNKIADINNQLIIKYNSKNEIFKSPVLGVKIDMHSKLGEKVFLFNKQFGVYDALVYSPNHGLDSESWEFKNESSYYKVYNKDWWWYKHND